MASDNFERNKLLLKWASKLDSSVNHKHVEELRIIRIFNKFQSTISNEECIPVGSCVEDSKVNIPGDIGDIDVLLISGKVIMKEELFEYVPGYPAFLCIPVINEHRQIFRSIDVVDHKFVPACVLKDIHQNLFRAIKILVRTKSSPRENEPVLRYTKESAVGVEVNVLEGINMADLGIRYKKPETSYVDFICKIGNFLDGVITAESTEKHQNKNPDLAAPEFGDLKSIRRKNKAKYRFSTLYNSFCSIQDKYQQINNPENKRHRDQSRYEQDEINTFNDVTREDETNQCVNVSTPLSTLRVSLNEDDDLDIRFENNLEVETDFEEDATVNNKNKVTEEQMTSFEHADDGLMTDTNYQRNSQNASLKDPGVPLEFSNILSIDFVPALKVDGWPKVAEEWISRDRMWPSTRVVDNICKTGCQVVVKNLPNMTIKENVKHFRLSFAMSEIILAMNLNANQKLVWRILKAYQKAYLCSEPKVLSSYHWKNVVFWICEKTSEDVWQKCNVLNAVEESLDFMIECLTEKFLPQYFVRDMNLIIDCDYETIELVKQTVIAIREEPEMRLKMFIRNPPSARICCITFDEIKQIQDNYEKEMQVVGDTLLMYFQICQEMNDDKRNRCRFNDGFRDFVNELKAVFKEDNTDKGIVDDPKTNSFLQIFDTLAQCTEPRKRGESGSAKHMSKVSDLIGSFTSVILEELTETECEKKRNSTKSSKGKQGKNPKK